MADQFLFVYGKLRSGGALGMDRHFPGSKSAGDATVNGRLYDLGDYPGLVLDDAGSPTRGEVYEIDEETLRKLDEVEAAADYYRKLTEATLSNQKRTCWIYLPDPERCAGREIISSGDWIEHSTPKVRPSTP
jgi:gamma-glutamylcyclotransferase (GGCT)/AIG2-like uncharacterized protein YtfP